MLDVAAARKELESKTLLDIERATADTWAGRAAACYDLAHDAKDDATRTRRLEEAMNYRQEAIEHAAMTEDIPFLQGLITEIRKHQRTSGSATGKASAGSPASR